MIEIGIVLCCTGVGAGLGASLIVGGIVGIVAQYFKDEIGEFINSAIGSDGTQALGGGMSVMMGGVTINIGRNLIGKTGWGTAAGVVCIIIGVALAVFGVSELSEVAFDYNFIKELTGISDKAYANLYQALGYASTVIITVYSTLSQYYKLLNKKNLSKSLGNSIKEIRKETPDLKEAIDNLHNPDKKDATWELFSENGKKIPKSELYNNGGNGYYVSKADPNLKVPVKDGFPVFDDFAKAKVSIKDGFTAKRNVNVKLFNKELADQWSLNPNSIPSEYAEWFRIKGISTNALVDRHIDKLMNHFKLTWHEHQNKFSAQLIESSIHTASKGGFSHLGGISIVKKMEAAKKIANTINKISKGV